ncbi:MAG: CotH kinase family protein [Chloroflexota bacterium]
MKLYAFLLLTMTLLVPSLVLAETPTVALSFSEPRGFYEEPIELTLSTSASDATIRYTLDGTTPSPTIGLVYEGPLPIETTTPVRAVVVRDGVPLSPIVTHTYLFLRDVVQQGNSPAGYPEIFAATDQHGPYPADYEMDPEVVDDVAYQDLLQDGLTVIPTLSIVTDVDNLFDPETGIYFNSLEHGRDWERPLSVEWIEPNGRSGFQVDAGLRVHGGGSRVPRISPKKSFRLYFRSDYGPSKLNFDLFQDENAVVEFDKLVLRGGSNNKWHHWSASQRPIALYVRDQFARESQRAMGHVSPYGTYVHLYLNGLYWGVYNAVERIDDNYVTDYLGGEKADWDVVKMGPEGEVEVAEGSIAAWHKLFELAEGDMTDEAAFQAVLEYLDLENFVDYVILMHFIENNDWPDTNWYAARDRTGSEGFQFFAWDSEVSLKVKARNIIDSTYPFSPAELFQKLRVNDNFQMMFADRIHEHLFNDGALTAEATAARFAVLADHVSLPIIAESARWGDYRRDVYQRPDKGDQGPYELYTRNDFWLPARDKLLSQYFPVRTANVIEDYIEAGLYPSLAPPVFNHDGGHIIKGFRFVMSNQNPDKQGTIYYTLNNGDPRNPDGTVSLQAINGNDHAPRILNGVVRVNARIKDGETWSALQTGLFIADIEPNLVYVPLMPHR